MNKTFTLLVAVALSFGASAQTWVNWDFTVPADKQEEFNAVWAKFMASETGKALPMCFVSQHDMGEATHNTSISFIGESADALAPLFDYAAIMQSPEWMEPFMWFGMNADPYRTQTGYQIAASAQKEGNGYQAFWGVEVADPMATAGAFQQLIADSQPLMDEYNVEIALHQVLAGQPGAITHYIGGNFKDYATFIKASQVMYQSEGFGKFAMATQANVNPLTYTRTIMGAWNTGE